MKSINVGVNLNKIEKQVIELILNNPTVTSEKISIEINKTKRTVERYLKALKEKRYLERSGSNKNSHWKIIK